MSSLTKLFKPLTLVSGFILLTACAGQPVSLLNQGTNTGGTLYEAAVNLVCHDLEIHVSGMDVTDIFEVPKGTKLPAYDFQICQYMALTKTLYLIMSWVCHYLNTKVVRQKILV